MNTAFEEKAARNFLEFDDDSCICGKTGTDITPQISARIGQALAMGGNVVVGRNDTNAAIAITNALVSGALGAGADVWYMGSSFGAQLDYAMRLCNAKTGIFINADAYTKIYAYSQFSQKLSEAEQNRAEFAMNNDNAIKISAENFGRLNDISDIKLLYENAKCDKIADFPIAINSSNKQIKQICSRLGINADDAKITFQISNDGRKASAISLESGFVSFEQLAMICIENMLKNGKAPYVPKGFAKSAALIFEKYNKEIQYCDDMCEDFFTDGFELAFEVCKALDMQKKSLLQAKSALPKFAVAQRIVGISMPVESAVEKLRGFCESHKDISVIPAKSGKTLLLRAECAEYETAGELCDICQRILQSEN